jgi:hypothetical protein
LIDATLGLLHINAEPAMAIKSVMDRLIRLEAEAERIAKRSPRRMIDVVIERL